MKLNTLNFKLITFIVTALTIATFCIAFFTNHKVISIIDKNQAEIYSGKLGDILDYLNRSQERLKKTMMVEAYKKQFQNIAIDTLRKSNYVSEDQQVYPFILDSSGCVIMHPKLLYGQDLNHHSFIQDMKKKPQSSFNYFYNGQRKWMTFEKFESWGWYIGYVIPLDIKYSDARAITKIFVIIMSLVIALVSIILSLVITKCTSPVTALTKMTSEIASGNLNYEISIKRNDELGVLAKSFIYMRDAVRDKINLIERQNRFMTSMVKKLKTEVEVRNQTEQALAKANSKLEMRVIERTKQLQEQKERAIELADKATAASKFKSEFLANMSHEIRTPMNAIIGFSELLAEENLTENQMAFIKQVKNSSNSLLAIINDILDFSKIEAGKLAIDNVEFNLLDSLNQIYEMLAPQAASKNIRFEIIKEADLSSIIYGDITRLNQCLINLTNNAIKFTERGHVHIKVSSSSIDGTGYINFQVADTGIGIPEDRLQAVFESFTQADGSTTRQFGGTGLGLTITKQLADLMGGSLTVKSVEGKGTCFKLTIPDGKEQICQVY